MQTCKTKMVNMVNIIPGKHQHVSIVTVTMLAWYILHSRCNVLSLFHFRSSLRFRCPLIDFTHGYWVNDPTVNRLTISLWQLPSILPFKLLCISNKHRDLPVMCMCVCVCECSASHFKWQTLVWEWDGKVPHIMCLWGSLTAICMSTVLPQPCNSNVQKMRIMSPKISLPDIK